MPHQAIKQRPSSRCHTERYPTTAQCHLFRFCNMRRQKEVERIPERCPCPKCSAMPWPLGGSRAIRHRGLGSSAISEQPFSRSGFRNMCSSFRAKFGTVDQRSLRGTVGSTSTLENLQLQGTWQWQHRGKAWGAKPGSEARQGPCALFRVAGLWGASKGRHRSICTAL